MNQTRHRNDIFAYLIMIAAVLAVVCLVAAIALCVVKSVKGGAEPTATAAPAGKTDEKPVMANPADMLLGETPDAGTAYIDKMIFLGESTTAHLRSRGVLTGGKDTKQVWADSSGTKTLSARLLYDTIVYPPTGESLTIAQALEKEKPAYLVLSFGLNGAAGFFANNGQYVSAYLKLIDAVQAASPNTRIILQTVYPVSASYNGFDGMDGTTVCQNLQKLNRSLLEIAASRENVRVVDTASVLSGADGTLDPRFDNGDGVHLSTSAYEEILLYLRTHAWQEAQS